MPGADHRQAVSSVAAMALPLLALCVLGDAMAMPIGSMIAKFREEFEAHIEAARARNDALTTAVAPPEALIQGAVV